MSSIADLTAAGRLVAAVFMTLEGSGGPGAPDVPGEGVPRVPASEHPVMCAMGTACLL